MVAKMLVALMVFGVSGWAAGHPVSGSMDVRWHEGASDCDTMAWEPLQVHTYEASTFIIRQNPCAHFEASFIYLLLGSEQALLIDTGAVAEADRMPLMQTVLSLLQGHGGSPTPLMVVHSHGHRDHRMGDEQFESVSSARLVPAGEGMREFFGFDGWPDGEARIDLGGRIIHVMPAPGHHPDHLVFYDERTALLFTGDFLLPGRLLVDDLEAYRESVSRIIAFVADRPVAHVLGGHLELDARGRPFRRGATHRPDQGRLELAKDDLLLLAAALGEFNRFYARYPRFIISHPMNNLMVLSVLLLAALIFAIWGLVRFSRSRGPTRKQPSDR